MQGRRRKPKDRSVGYSGRSGGRAQAPRGVEQEDGGGDRSAEGREGEDHGALTELEDKLKASEEQRRVASKAKSLSLANSRWRRCGSPGGG